MEFFHTPGHTMSYNPSEALARIDNDKGLLIMLISIFIQESKKYIDGLQTACDAQNLNALGDAAHTIKGASAAIGFDECRILAEALEITCRQSGVKSIAYFENSTDVLVKLLKVCAVPLNEWVERNK